MSATGNIVWLASYPKSGNTWFRIFLSALLNQSAEMDLNGLKADGLFANRRIFSHYTDLDSRYLYDEEAKLLLPLIYNRLSKESSHLQFVKIHDAFSYNKCGNPIVPLEASKYAVYFIRNPLDIVASFANHWNISIKETIKIMNDPMACISWQHNNHNTATHLQQLLLNWSGHVQSWTSSLAFPALVLRYEDMLADTFKVFTQAVNFIGIKTTPEKIQQAIDATTFKELQEKERKSGFSEKLNSQSNFFRKGSSGNWINELTKVEAQSILDCHYKVMTQFGYDVNLDKFYIN